MRRTRNPNRPALARGTARLIRVAIELGDSGSQLEDTFWKRSVEAEVLPLLHAGNDKGLENALEHLWQQNPRAHDMAADVIEASSESGEIEINGRRCQTLMLVLPVLAWSRNSIPTGKLPKSTLDALRAQLAGHILARDTHIALADGLFSPDQMPMSFSETSERHQEFIEALAKSTDIALDFDHWPESSPFIADSRFVMATVAAPLGMPMFRWQEEEINREKLALTWAEQAGGAFKSAFSGCAYEALLPGAFHSATRRADRESRAYTLRAGVQFLELNAGLKPDNIVAVVGGCYDREMEEYRIGLLARGRSEVLHGVVWPVLGGEMEENIALDEIEALLKELGVKEVMVLDQRLPLEQCSDCGAAFFPDTEGDLVHTDYPEDHEVPSQRFH